jgi:membrane protein DedA with SNARE-associated domain
MENFLPQTLVLWLTQYGSFALFVLLALGIFALPIPDETLMVFAGALIAHGKLDAIPTLIAAFLGSCTGISISYVVGRTAGTFIIKKYGKWLHLTESKMQRVHNWFERVGRWALLIGYFIPGVRHVTGYAAGVTVLEYRHFALFSYGGALIWVCTFLSVGYFLGNKWTNITNVLEEQWYKIVLVVLALGLLAALYVWLKKRIKRIKKS